MLKDMKVITPISQDHFILSYKPVFKPEIDDFQKKIHLRVEKQFPSLKQCIWSTKAVNEFMLHLPVKFITVLQVEREAIEPVFDFIQSLNFGTVYIEPDKKEIERYIFETERSIVLQSLISRAPLQKIGNVTTVTLEKIIVDLFSDRNLFSAFQGRELVYIINNAYKKYLVNFTTLFHYAGRRGKEKDLRRFLLEKTDIPKNIINDKS